MSPTQRSLKKLRDEGYTVEVVEKWNPWSRTRKDLFGFADLLAFRNSVVLAVQTTSGPHAAERKEKVMATQAAHLWLESAYRQIQIHGWRKVGPRGKRKVWECRVIYC